MNWWVLRRKFHVSWLLAITCAGVFMGVFSAQYVHYESTSSISILLIAILLIAIVLWKKYTYLIPFLIVGGVLVGIWRGSVSQVEISRFKPLFGHSILIEGMVKDDVDIGSSNQLVIRLDNLSFLGKPMPGTLWVTTSPGPDIKRGDKLRLHGTLKPGFGTFSGTMYFATVDEIIHPNPGDIARIARDWFSSAVRIGIPSPESSLGIGFLVGQRRALPADLISALKLAGLTHIIVASGYNLTVLVRLIRRLFSKLSKYLSTILTSLVVIAFMAIAGLSPSMMRAGLVTGLSLAAWYYGRKFHPIILLLVAIAITVLINPSYAWGDLGWQLSFAAFAGVMIIAPLAQRYFFGDKKPGMIQQILGETIAAQLATAPILIVSFNQISNVAIIANLLVLPLVPIAMLLTFIAGLGGLIIPTISSFIALPATLLLSYQVKVTEYLASLPWVTSVVNLQWWGIALIYAIIIATCVYMWRITKYNLRETNLVE